MHDPPTPLVSVIIPAFNSERFIARAIDSVLAQDWPAIEVIVVDDGSSDGTGDIARRYGEPVRCLRQPNRGPAAARNLGLGEARGEFVAFLDSDDVYLPGRLRRGLAPMLGDEQVVLTWSYCLARHGDGRGEIHGLRAERGRIFPALVFMPATMHTPGVTCRRRLLEQAGGFHEDLRAFEDHDLWRRLAELGRVVAIEEPLAVVHLRPDSLSAGADYQRIETACRQIVEAALARRPELYGPHRDTILADMWYFLGRRRYAALQMGEARGCFVRALRHRFHPVVLYTLLKSYLPHYLLLKLRRFRLRREADRYHKPLDL